MADAGDATTDVDKFIGEPVEPRSSGALVANEAAPGVPRQEVEAVNAKANRPLYEARQKVHPKRARGTFRSIKWVVMVVTLGIYYLLPWLRWNRGDHLPDQAILLDFANQRLFFGPFEIWPQEFYYITGLLVIAALALFLVTSLAGRVWCGYACPQTVWTDLMIAVERFWQGDRNARLRLDKSPWTFDKIYKKSATHLSWLLIGVATGGALVFYFRDAPTLARELVTGTAPAIAYLFLGIFAFTTYLLGGIAREQVCIYMCPWPRIQGAMFDQDSLLVSYRAYRGEPRGPHKKNDTWQGRGDCIACRQCVVVCPVGIDIRHGPQLECIQCALCIDACNDIMKKVGRPQNLIAYDTFRNLAAVEAGEKAKFRPIRPRTVLYLVLIPVILALMMVGWMNRSELDVSVLRDRNPLFVRLSDGGIRNGYTIKILNKRYDPREFRLSVKGLDAAELDIVGLEDNETPTISVLPDNLRSMRVYLSLGSDAVKQLSDEATPLEFVVTDLGDSAQSARSTTFRRPKQ